LYLQSARETVFSDLGVPLFNPSVGAHGLVNLLEILAGRVVLTLDTSATVEIYIALVAVPVKSNYTIIIN
jgi:hypothetical protein